ncbi:MAG TPA: MOSC domain-containing protein [Ktedonobacteraceae bacterium]|jgi:MOSC domain-containing protein YiiM
MVEANDTHLQVGVIHSLQVGVPKRYASKDAANPLERVWCTSFFREPSLQARWLYTTHLEGNQQADTKHHGQLSQAVLLYAAAHYSRWSTELNRPEIGPGGFGENLTLTGLSEETSCIGDVYSLGEAHIQVTEPRYPCWKIERRWGIAGLTARVAESGRTGWYCRVLCEGLIEPGMPLLLVERSYPQWTIALVNDIVHGRNRNVEQARLLAACPVLHGFWPELIVKRAIE